MTDEFIQFLRNKRIVRRFTKAMKLNRGFKTLQQYVDNEHAISYISKAFTWCNEERGIYFWDRIDDAWYSQMTKS